MQKKKKKLPFSIKNSILFHFPFFFQWKLVFIISLMKMCVVVLKSTFVIYMLWVTQ